MSAHFEKSFCPSRAHKKHISNEHKFPNYILKQVNCKTDYCILSTMKKTVIGRYPSQGWDMEQMLGKESGASDGGFESLLPLVNETLSSEIIILWLGVSTEFRDCMMRMLMEIKSKKAVKEKQERREDISRWDLKWEPELMRWSHTDGSSRWQGLQ